MFHPDDIQTRNSQTNMLSQYEFETWFYADDAQRALRSYAAAINAGDEPNEADLDTLEAVYKELRDEMRGPEWAIERLIETTPDAETVSGTPELYIVKEAA